MNNKIKKMQYKVMAKGFTFVELLIVTVLLALIVIATYKAFFSQTKMVRQSIEYFQVNDSFRKVMSFIGNDIKEATNIIYPLPIMQKDVPGLTTKPGLIIKIISKEINHRIAFNSPFGGQVSAQRTITYELEKNTANTSNVPQFRLIRTVLYQEKPGDKAKQRQVLVNNIREFIAFRTVRIPYKPSNISSSKDRIVIPRPNFESGTGNNLVHIRMTLERPKKEGEGEVYQISMNTSFYKRGKEIFINQ
jgi:prepilin-type N-terminal cleavage/methylation domain-containing protein